MITFTKNLLALSFFNSISKKSSILFVFLLVVWSTVFKQTFAWLLELAANPAFRLNLMLLLTVSTIVFIRAAQSMIKYKIKLEPYWNKFSFIIILISVSWHLLNIYTARIMMLSTILFFVGGYGLFMMFTPSHFHKWGTMPLGLLLTTLPFSYNFNVLFGFPLRLQIADFVHHILSNFGVQSLSSHTIIFIENRAAHIDYTCSGIQGFCCAFICFFSLSWIEKKKLSFPWLLLLIGFLISILIGNTLRVLLLVILYALCNQIPLANMVHTMIGLLTFILPSVIVYLLFRKTNWFPQRSIQLLPNPTNKSSLPAYLLLICLFPLSCIPMRQRKQITAKPFQLILNDFNLEDIPLTNGEARLLGEYAVSLYCKKNFISNNVKGSFFLVKSNHFKAHHNPQTCLQSNGFRISDSKMLLLKPNFPVRYLSLNGGALSAYYWFTSNKSITDDYSERIWNHFFNNDLEWIMTSVLFDGEYTPENAEASKFIFSLQQTIDSLIQRSNYGNLSIKP